MVTTTATLLYQTAKNKSTMNIVLLKQKMSKILDVFMATLL